jgi:MFS family permease
MIAMMICLLLGGVVADRLPRHQVIIASDGLQAIAQAVSAFLILTDHALIWELVVLAVVRGVGFGFYMPAAQGLLPQTVSSEDLGQANAISSVGSQTAQIGGATLGGILVAFAGPGWGLAADAASFAAAGFLRVWMRFAALPATASKNIISDLHEGWHEFISRRWLWVVVVQFSGIAAISVGVLTVLGPVVAQAHLGGARNWGIIMSAYAAGSILCGLIMIRFRFGRALMAGLLCGQAFALFLFALAVPLAVPLVTATAFLAGVGTQVFDVGWATTMQQQIPQRILSRLSAYDILGSIALTPLGIVAEGLLAKAYGADVVLTIGGALIVALTIAVLCVGDVRHLRPASDS